MKAENSQDCDESFLVFSCLTWLLRRHETVHVVFFFLHYIFLESSGKRTHGMRSKRRNEKKWAETRGKKRENEGDTRKLRRCDIHETGNEDESSLTKKIVVADLEGRFKLLETTTTKTKEPHADRMRSDRKVHEQIRTSLRSDISITFLSRKSCILSKREILC